MPGLPIDPSKYPVLLIFMTCTYAFLAGLGVAVILGPRAFHSIPTGLAIYGTVCSLMCTVLFSFIVIRLLRRSTH
jgi:hypothetical protein